MRRSDGGLEWICSRCGKRSRWRAGWLWKGRDSELESYGLVRFVLCQWCATPAQVAAAERFEQEHSERRR